MLSTEVETPAEQSTASLVAGILGDVQQLVRQQFLLTRREIEDGLRQRAAGVKMIGAGAFVLFLSSILFCLTLVYLLHWLMSPPGIDQASIPLWGCHAVVTAILGVIGLLLTQMGRSRLRSVKPLTSSLGELSQEQGSWTPAEK